MSEIRMSKSQKTSKRAKDTKDSCTKRVTGTLTVADHQMLRGAGGENLLPGVPGKKSVPEKYFCPELV